MNSNAQDMDSTLVVNILKEKKYISNTTIFKEVRYNNINNKWTVLFSEYKTSRKGNCKKTNGCTIEFYNIVIVSDKTKKIVRKKVKKIVYPNYE